MKIQGLFICSVYYLAAFYVFSVISDDVGLECFPNATIVMDNPNSNFFTNGVANDSSQICDVTFRQNNTKIFIDNCLLDDNILLSLNNRTTLDVVMGGMSSSLYLIQCNGVGANGVNMSVSHTFQPNVPVTSEAPRTEESYAESTFRQGTTSGVELSSANVGSKIIWSMETAEEHFLSILNCTAYGGQSMSSPVNLVLIVNGCSQDKSLVTTDFQTNNYDVVSGEKRYYADFYVFKFMAYDYITIGCTVKICPATDNVCAMAPCSTGRRRRAVDQEEPSLDHSEFRSLSKTIRVMETLSAANTVMSTYYLLVLTITVTIAHLVCN